MENDKGDNFINNPAYKKRSNLIEASSDDESTLSDIVVHLKKCGYPLENCFISFFSPIFSAYINCGLDPLPNQIKVTKDDLTLVNENGREFYKLLLKF